MQGNCRHKKTQIPAWTPCSALGPSWRVDRVGLCPHPTLPQDPGLGEVLLFSICTDTLRDGLSHLFPKIMGKGRLSLLVAKDGDS